jgi:uncharacterized membrane protein
MIFDSSHPSPRQMRGSSRRLWFFALYAVGCASVATATGYVGYSPSAAVLVPHAVQIVLGLLMVFVVPGLSLVRAALLEFRSWVERLLACVGISVTVAICACVLLAATPIGFSRQPLAELLGGVVILLSLGDFHRSQLAAGAKKLRAVKHAWLQAHSMAVHRSTRPHNSAGHPRDIDLDVRRSIVVLNFSFDSNPDDRRS